jgi:hypothetical protein
MKYISMKMEPNGRTPPRTMWTHGCRYLPSRHFDTPNKYRYMCKFGYIYKQRYMHEYTYHFFSGI